MQMAFVLMQQYWEIEIEYDHDLSDDSELTKVPNIGIVAVHVTDEHDAV